MKSTGRLIMVRLLLLRRDTTPLTFDGKPHAKRFAGRNIGLASVRLRSVVSARDAERGAQTRHCMN
jgi:hypothetical protein